MSDFLDIKTTRGHSLFQHSLKMRLDQGVSGAFVSKKIVRPFAEAELAIDVQTHQPLGDARENIFRLLVIHAAETLKGYEAGPEDYDVFRGMPQLQLGNYTWWNQETLGQNYEEYLTGHHEGLGSILTTWLVPRLFIEAKDENPFQYKLPNGIDIQANARLTQLNFVSTQIQLMNIVPNRVNYVLPCRTAEDIRIRNSEALAATLALVGTFE